MFRFGFFGISVFLFSMTPAKSDDWPMWRHDPGRTASVNGTVPENPVVIWSRDLIPQVPAYRDIRLQFDASFEPIVLGTRLFLGSNGEDSLTALDAESGADLWKFYANGPIRFAPVGGDDRIIFGSDDGCVYCLKASDGTLLWKKRAVPSERFVLGNERLISVWPVRGGPVLQDGKVYFAAGVWPLEGTFVFCIDAATGATIWRNDRASYLYGAHPHNAEAFGGLAPQGYLLMDGDDLIVPCSQGYPARFARETGELKEFELPAVSRIPGGWFSSTPADQEAQKLKRRGILFDDEVNAKPHEDKPRKEGLPGIRESLRVGSKEWKYSDSLSVAGIEGAVTSTIAANGSLFVVTNKNRLYRLGEKVEGKAPVHHERSVPAATTAAGSQMPPPNFPTSGYAVFLGLPDSGIPESLRKMPNLRVIGVDRDGHRVASLRASGSRALIEMDPAGIRLPPYFAGAIVVEESVTWNEELLRHLYESLRPYGGMLLSRSSKLADMGKSINLPRARVSMSEGWSQIFREGALEGATNYHGDWAPSEDLRVKAPLGLLWYGDAVTHFKRSPQPKFVDGVMISNPKDWTDASTRKGPVDYRLLETCFTDLYTGRQLAPTEEPALRQSYTDVDLETIQPSQYRPPQQKDDWKPEAPRAGERVNLLTGLTESRVFPKSYGCDGGVDYGLIYSMRSGTPAFYDKRSESGTINISGPRSGCTNSIIPANGVLNLPFFYEGCTCAYPLPVSLALVGMPETFEQWASWGLVEPGSLTGKIHRIGLNFGAPGDRVTDDGTLWLDLPNVGGPSPDIAVTTEPPLTEVKPFYRHSLFLKAGGKGWPWVAGSGVEGVNVVTVSGMKAGTYRVKISVAVPDEMLGLHPGSLKIQAGDQTASLEQKAISSGVAQWVELEGVKTAPDGSLRIEFSSENGNPILNGIEVIDVGLPSSPPPSW
jgi:hypothetical protein